MSAAIETAAPAPAAPPPPPLPDVACDLEDEPSTWHRVGSVAAYVLANLAATLSSREEDAGDY